MFNLQVSGHPSYYAGGVLVHNCHLVNPGGKEAGRYRQFLADLAKLCQFRVVGYTATPFRGNGVWLTDGDAPLFTGIACTVTMQEMMQAGFLAPLVRPVDTLGTRISTDGISATGGDYNLDQLSERVEDYLEAAALEAVQLAQERKKWIAFTPTVRNAEHLVRLLQGHGISAALVCGDTPARERAQHIAQFRAGHIRCLVTVLALAVGFDVPDVDCILWLRPTQSPVLYVQGAGRGTRIAPGKQDCLWLDFSDTTERMGPVDAIRGRKKKKSSDREAAAPFRICDQCGERCAPALPACPSCGYVFPVEAKETRSASNAAILSAQVAPKLVVYPVDSVRYSVHRKDGSPDSLRVDYLSGLRRVASEWVCLEHGGFAGAKAKAWWDKRAPREYRPASVQQAMDWIDDGYQLAKPSAITINETGKYPEIVRHHWEPVDEPATA